MTTYTTYTEAVESEVVAALGDYANQHDIDAIAREVIEATGEGTSYGFRLSAEYRDPATFWGVVEAHAL